MQRLSNEVGGSSYRVYGAAVLISILLSFWTHHQTVVVNPDAICYLQSAKAASLGLGAVMSLCDQSAWPFYSLLIVGVVRLTHLSYEQAAFLVDGLFSLLTVCVFIRLTAFFSPKKTVLWFAAFVILLAHEFNAVRSDIIRDHGFWFFYLLSLFFLLQYFRYKKSAYAIAWGSSLIAATLFRIEGAIFLLALPWVAWFETNQTLALRCQSFLRLNVPLLLVAAVLLVAMAFHPHLSLGRLYELRERLQLTHLYTELVQHYMVLADGLGRAVLNPSEHDTYLIYFFTLVFWYTLIVISVLSLLYAVLLVYAWKEKVFPAERGRYVIGGYIVINIVMTFVFLIEHQFLSKRYLVALALTLMLWIPFALDHLAAQWPRRKWPLVLALFLMSVSGLGGVLHGADAKQFIRDAGDWLKHNTPPTAAIYSNDYQVMYYSDHFGNQVFAKRLAFADLHQLQGGKWRQYDYLAIRFNPKTRAENAVLFDEMKQVPFIVFQSQRNQDQVRIYRRSQE